MTRRAACTYKSIETYKAHKIHFIDMEESMVIRATTRETGPSEADLAAIEMEWPLIEAEMAVVDAEVRLLTAVGGPSPLDWRRLRRAEDRVLREAVALVDRFRPRRGAVA